MDAYRVPTDALGGLLGLLQACPAFMGVDPAQLEDLARDAEIVYLATPGEEDPALSQRCLIVQRGSLRVRDTNKGQAVDLLAAGEFHAPAAGHIVEPWEPSLVVLLADDAAGLAWSAGPRARQAAEPGLAPATADVRTAAVRTVMRAPVLTAEPAEPCHAAAARMRAHRVSSLLVLQGGRTGILTDRDLRNRLVAEGAPSDAPVSEIATFPVRTVGPDTPVFEALVEMLAAGIHHLPVAEGERIVGMLSAGDLLRLDGRSPIHLRAAVDRAADVDEVAAARKQVVAAVRALLEAGAGGGEVARVIAAVSDRVTARLLSLAIDDLGPAPGAFTWLALGSHGRREQTLASDQDTGILYADGLEGEWFAELGRWMTAALERCGYPRCPGGVMAAEHPWRGSVSVWRQRFWDWVDIPTGKNLLAVQTAFDLRSVGGDMDARALLAMAISRTAGRDLFLAHLAQACVRHRPPLGFLGRMTVDRSGEHAGTFDIKAGAMLPIVDLGRLYALAAGSTALGTDERLAVAAHEGQASADLIATLREGHDVAMRVRLRLHLDQEEADDKPSNRLDPSTLSPLVRSELRETFKAVRSAQEDLASRYHTGMLG